MGSVGRLGPVADVSGRQEQPCCGSGRRLPPGYDGVSPFLGTSRFPSAALAAHSMTTPTAGRLESRISWPMVVALLCLPTAGLIGTAYWFNELSSRAHQAILLGGAAASAVGSLLALWRRSTVWSAVAWLAALAGVAAFWDGWLPTSTLAADLSAALVRDSALALAVAPLLALVRFVSPAKAALASGSTLLAVLAVDSAAVVYNASQLTWRDVRWAGEGWRMEDHPQLGRCHWPWGWLKGYYPGNPRNYFEVETPGDAIDMRCWTPEMIDGCTLEFVRPLAGDGTLSLTFHCTPLNAAPQGLTIHHIDVPLAPRGKYRATFRARADGPQRVTMGMHGHGGMPLAQVQAELGDAWQDIALPFSNNEQTTAGALRFTTAQPDVRVELTAVQVSREPPVSGARAAPRYSVTYNFNGEGFRDPMWTPEPAPGVRRISVHGDSFVLGYGVHVPDRMTNLLEASLNGAAGASRWEVLNCGSMGFSTHQSRASYEHVAARYGPSIVIFCTILDDGVSAAEDAQLDTIRKWSQVERSTGLAREFYKRRFANLQEIRSQRDRQSVIEILALSDTCRENDAKLLVVIYRLQDAPNWQQFAQAIQQGLADSEAPVLDLYPYLSRNHTEKDLYVMPVVDHHPSEIANRLAAEEIERYLRQLGWLNEQAAAADAP